MWDRSLSKWPSFKTYSCKLAHNLILKELDQSTFQYSTPDNKYLIHFQHSHLGCTMQYSLDFSLYLQTKSICSQTLIGYWRSLWGPSYLINDLSMIATWKHCMLTVAGQLYSAAASFKSQSLAHHHKACIFNKWLPVYTNAGHRAKVSSISGNGTQMAEWTLLRKK